MHEVLINGKFLGAGLNGVHRTAAEFTAQLIGKADKGTHPQIISPRPAPPGSTFASARTRVVKGRFGRGQGWEMLTLPRVAQGRLLLNFCNLAPLLHGNSLVMIHDAQTFLFPRDYSGSQAQAYRRLLPWIGRRARRILTVSEFARQSLIRFGIGHPDKIEVVHNGTDHLLRHSPDSSLLRRFGLADESYVLVLGSTKEYKNMRTVFDALRDPLPGGQRLVIAGGPPAQAYRNKGWEPPASAVFTGFVSDAELRALYLGASVFLFPSLTEGFGLPPVEAMQCRTPVVAAAAGAMPEICGQGALLVAPQDSRAYRDATLAILDNRELADALIARGQQRAAHFTWDRAGDRLWETVSHLLPTD
ncbi:glycosyltransferase family 4 protein [Novosphingobium profundi]|nr:glycosyltransferase family 4 protein [Novosphingobium profundi]